MSVPAVDNRTEFAVHPQLLLDVDGEKLVTIVKASFEWVAGADELELAPAERMRQVRLADIPWGEPEVSSVAYPGDLCLRKPGTDVIVVGRAYAPHGQPVPAFDARVEVGALAKSLRIFGLRIWESGGAGLSSAAPISELDLRWEYAWGGFDDSDPEKPAEEPRNPVGRGKVCDPDALADQPGPQIEDPGALISSYRTEPAPAGVGAIGRHWEPRRRYAGTYDPAWQQTRAPLPPVDLDDRFNHCATPDLVASTPLRGGEAVRLLNLLPGGGATAFALPQVPLHIEFRVPGRDPMRFQPPLDTVLIDLLETNDEKPPAVELVWRAHVKAPRRLTEARVVVRELEVS